MLFLAFFSQDFAQSAAHVLFRHVFEMFLIRRHSYLSSIQMIVGGIVPIRGAIDTVCDLREAENPNLIFIKCSTIVEQTV